MAEVYYRVSTDELDEIYRFHYNYTADLRSRYTWEWEYGATNPVNSLLLAIKLDGQVIATQGILCIKVAFGNELHMTGKNESLLIDKPHRGKSLSTRFYNYAIGEYEKEGVSCLWGFSSKAVIPLSKAKFRVFDNIMKRMVLSIYYNHAVKLIPKFKKNRLAQIMYKSKILLATLYSSAFFKVYKSLSNKYSEKIELTEELRDSNDLLDLYKDLLVENPDLIYIYQDKDYFNWRIRKSPQAIKTIFLYENNRLRGYFYLTTTERYSELTDFTFTHDLYGNILIKELFAIIDFNKIGFIYYTGNSTNKLNQKVLSLLSKRGFLKMKGPSSFVLRNYSFADEGKLFKIQNWYMNELWSEGN